MADRADDLASLSWRKSSRTQAQGQCVEHARLGAQHAVRDSKDPSGRVLIFGGSQWRAFMTEVKAGVHDIK